MNVLISGLPGSGKTAISRYIDSSKVVDLDDFGYWQDRKWDDGQAWIYRTTAIKHLMNNSSYDFYAGNCENLTKPVTTTDPFGPNKHESIASLDWDLKLFLWYEPVSQEMTFRFDSNRDNPFGKSVEEKRRIAETANKTRLGIDGFQLIDVTGVRTEIDLLRMIEDEVKGVPGRETLDVDEARDILEHQGLPLVLTDDLGSYRVIYEMEDTLVVVKIFPYAEDPDKWSVKFYYPTESLVKVMTYWHTIQPVDAPMIKRTADETLTLLLSRFGYKVKQQEIQI